VVRCDACRLSFPHPEDSFVATLALALAAAAFGTKNVFPPDVAAGYHTHSWKLLLAPRRCRSLIMEALAREFALVGGTLAHALCF
jgi:hypothetical protein